MRVERFEDILAWQRARDLARRIYNQFGCSKDYGFKDQIQRAAVSVMNNIAEGFDYGSDTMFIKYLDNSIFFFYLNMIVIVYIV